MFKPSYEITNKLLQNIKKIAEINTEYKTMKISDVVYSELIENAVFLSTFSSTGIDGNPLPLSEVRKLLTSKPKHLRDSEKEIINYHDVLKYMTPLFKKETIQIDLKFIQKIHMKTMNELTENHHLGRWRKESGYLNNPLSGIQIYLPPDHKDVPKLIEETIKFIESEKDKIDPIIMAGIFHKEFHIIFPFTEGNGRIARLLTNMLLINSDISKLPLFSFDNYYNKNIPKYFKMLGISGNYYEMSKKIKFTEWLEYFTDGIIDEMLRVKKELEMKEFSPAEELKPHHEIVLEIIQKNGFITDKRYAQSTDRAKATRALDFKHLMEMGYIIRKGQGKNTYYILKR